VVIREALAASAQVIVSKELFDTHQDDVIAVDAGDPKTMARALEGALKGELRHTASSLESLGWNDVGPRLLPA
jgi:hypothetical protein